MSMNAVVQALEFLTKMDAPFAFAIIGLAWAIGVPIMVRRLSQREERIEVLKLKRAIQLESFKKGALTRIEESS